MLKMPDAASSGKIPVTRNKRLSALRTRALALQAKCDIGHEDKSPVLHSEGDGKLARRACGH